ncbi:hypothetical protein [Streptomyces nigra]|uniref:Ada DNA repair metal-binding domain-containing protein n=1 Tax=Streptomyces nigra TaxID=1827580 RepID=A0ABZ1IWJ2_9ACTN
MESATAAQERLRARQQELQNELAQVQQHLKQLETMVVASQWRYAPSGPKGRGTVYHTTENRRCRLTNGPEEITLYEALQTGLSPCSQCRPKGA